MSEEKKLIKVTVIYEPAPPWNEELEKDLMIVMGKYGLVMTDSGTGFGERVLEFYPSSDQLYSNREAEAEEVLSREYCFWCGYVNNPHDCPGKLLGEPR